MKNKWRTWFRIQSLTPLKIILYGEDDKDAVLAKERIEFYTKMDDEQWVTYVEDNEDPRYHPAALRGDWWLPIEVEVEDGT